MARKRLAWTRSELQKLIENYDLPIQQLIEMFPRHNQASINRKLAHLRKEGKIGKKSAETIQKAYKLRPT